MKTISEIINKGTWKRPNSYMGPDHVETFSIGIGQTRDSDNAAKSNFETALEMLGGESEHVEVVRDSHWVCGWVEHIRISKTAPKKILETACEIVNSLENYPLLDDDNYFELKNEEIEEHANDCRTEAAEFLAKNSDLPEDLIDEVSKIVAYEVVYETEAYSGEIWFDEDYAQEIVNKQTNACAGGEVFEQLRTLNFG